MAEWYGCLPGAPEPLGGGRGVTRGRTTVKICTQTNKTHACMHTCMQGAGTRHTQRNHVSKNKTKNQKQNKQTKKRVAVSQLPSHLPSSQENLKRSVKWRESLHPRGDYLMSGVDP